jgi:hypothetical protein
MKILFPHGGAAKEDVDMVLRFAIFLCPFFTPETKKCIKCVLN